jgi:hypothetical protein
MQIAHSFSVARWALVVAVLALLVACATGGPPPGTPTVERWTRPPVGASWVNTYKTSGSYGTETGQLTYKFLGDQDFQGKSFLAYSVDEIDVTYYDPSGRLVGRTVKGALRETSDPGFQSFAWPLYVGRSWVHTSRFIDHAAGRTFDGVQFWSKAEAYEDVTTAAGTFKAFRIVPRQPECAVHQLVEPRPLGYLLCRRGAAGDGA